MGSPSADSHLRSLTARTVTTGSSLVESHQVVLPCGISRGNFLIYRCSPMTLLPRRPFHGKLKEAITSWQSTSVNDFHHLTDCHKFLWYCHTLPTTGCLHLVEGSWTPTLRNVALGALPMYLFFVSILLDSDSSGDQKLGESSG